jgi:hypothetical protein
MVLRALETLDRRPRLKRYLERLAALGDTRVATMLSERTTTLPARLEHHSLLNVVYFYCSLDLTIFI